MALEPGARAVEAAVLGPWRDGDGGQHQPPVLGIIIGTQNG